MQPYRSGGRPLVGVRQKTEALPNPAKIPFLAQTSRQQVDYEEREGDYLKQAVEEVDEIP